VKTEIVMKKLLAFIVGALFCSVRGEEFGGRQRLNCGKID
jgi:hypothetical protein